MTDARPADTARERIAQFLQETGRADAVASVVPLTGDASDRRYFRLLLRGDAPQVLCVHAGAIQTFERKTVVFVREGGDKLEARPVELGNSDQRFVEIRAGLSPGEKYVAENSFVVKAEMGKGEAEHD